MCQQDSQRGRPRSESSRRAVLETAFAMLCEVGYGAMSIEALAQRAGVGKTTIYRWWPDRASLAVDAFFEATGTMLVLSDTGSARDDFRDQIGRLCALLRGPAGAAMAGLVVGARGEPKLARALFERWVLPRKRWGVERLQRAIAAGECRADLDIDAALDLLYGPPYARLLMGAGAMTEAQVNAYLDLALAGIFCNTPTTG